MTGYVPTNGISERRDMAQRRGDDATYGMLEWSPPSRPPSNAGFFATREKLDASSNIRKVLFTGKFWMSDRPVAAWRPLTALELNPNDKPISDLHGVLIENGAEAPAVAKSFDELSLVPMDNFPGQELQVVKRLSELELNIEVVKFSKPNKADAGIVSGRVLAVSQNFSAQQAGPESVVIHENKDLTRSLTPGEDATLAYKNGKATVFSGIAHDVNIVAPWMPAEQRAYLRMTMLDALSTMKSPASEEEKLRDAMRYALESAARFFGLQETKLRRADINLVVNEMTSKFSGTEAHAAPATPPRARM